MYFETDYREWAARASKLDLAISRASMSDYSKHPGLAFLCITTAGIGHLLGYATQSSFQYLGGVIFAATNLAIVSLGFSLFTRACVKPTRDGDNALLHFMLFGTFLLSGSSFIMSIPESFGFATGALMLVTVMYSNARMARIKRLMLCVLIAGGTTVTNVLFVGLCELVRLIQDRVRDSTIATKTYRLGYCLTTSLREKTSHYFPQGYRYSTAFKVLLAAIGTGFLLLMGLAIWILSKSYIKSYHAYANHRLMTNPGSALVYAIWGTVAP